jgi:uncharacterized membrane protein
MRRAEDELLRMPKRPTRPISGPYGHPFHPILVTIPIGAWVAGFVFDLVSRAVRPADAAAWAQGAYWLIAIGVIGALLAAVFGLIDLLGVPRGTPAFRTGLLHLGLNLCVVGLFAASFAIRKAGDTYDKPTSIGLIVLSAIALAALLVSGWLGGKMAYRYGVRVALEGDHAEGFRATGRRTVRDRAA